MLKEYEDIREAVKKGVADVMGGKVLQLESERLLAEGADDLKTTVVHDDMPQPLSSVVLRVVFQILIE